MPELPYNENKKAKGETDTVDIFTCGIGYIVVTILLVLFSGYAYLVNFYRAADDPEKKDIELSGIALTPLWPFQLLFGVVGTVFKAVLFGIILLLFSVGAVVIRKPFFWRWIKPIVLGIGNRLMKANTFLIRLFDRRQ
jgi:hypothetical protein